MSPRDCTAQLRAFSAFSSLCPSYVFKVEIQAIWSKRLACWSRSGLLGETPITCWAWVDIANGCVCSIVHAHVQSGARVMSWNEASSLSYPLRKGWHSADFRNGIRNRFDTSFYRDCTSIYSTVVALYIQGECLYTQNSRSHVQKKKYTYTSIKVHLKKTHMSVWLNYNINSKYEYLTCSIC